MTYLELIGLISGVCSIIGLLIVLREKISALFQNRIVWSAVLNAAKILSVKWKMTITYPM
jgi:hypothetical protein